MDTRTKDPTAGGGTRTVSDDWQHLLFNLAGLHELVTINATEGSAYGAALLAATGTGCFASIEEACRACIRVTGRCEPDPERVRIYEEYYAVYRDLYWRLRESFRMVASITADYCPLPSDR